MFVRLSNLTVVLIYLFFLYGCGISTDRKKTIVLCSSKQQRTFLNNDKNNCTCLFDKLSEANFSREEIYWFMSLNTMGRSMSQKGYLAQSKVAKYVNSKNVLSICGMSDNRK